MTGNIETRVEFKPSLAELQARNKKRMDELADNKTAFQAASIYLDQWVHKNFKTEGGNVGGWEPFKLGGRWRKGQGIDTSAKLLRDTGRLDASFLPFAEKDDGGIFSDLPYAKPHQEGTGKLPKRRLLPVRKEVIEKLKLIFERFVNKAIK